MNMMDKARSVLSNVDLDAINEQVDKLQEKIPNDGVNQRIDNFQDRLGNSGNAVVDGADGPKDLVQGS